MPGLAVAAILGGIVADPFRRRFLADAIVASILFVTTRHPRPRPYPADSRRRRSGFDWRRNPSWVGLVTVIVVMTAALAIPASSVAAPAIGFVVIISIQPLLLVGLIAGLFGGFDRRSFRILAITIVAVFVIAGVFSLLGSQAVDLGELGPAGPEVLASPPVELMALGGVLLLVMAVIAIVVLARLWMRRTALIEDDLFETRTIDRGAGARRNSRRRFDGGAGAVLIQSTR